MTTKYTSFSDIAAHNYFEIYYSSYQQRIVFQAILKYASCLDDQPTLKYLGWQNGCLTLVNYEFIFEVEHIKKGDGIFTNTPFLIKIPNSDKYLRATPSTEKEANNITCGRIDSKNAKQFYFHLRNMQAHDLSQLRIRDIDRKLCDAYSDLERIERVGIDNINANELLETYTQVKKDLDNAPLWLEDREPNKWKLGVLERMCLNGYYNDKQTILSHNTFNYQWYLEKVKDLRRNLILNSIDLFEIEIHPSFCYYVQSEYLLALGLKSQNPDFCSVLKQAKSIISDPRECAEGNNDYKRIMMLQKIVANCYRRRRDYCIYEKECFLPFIQYELGKDMNSCNLNNLLGLISNKFRDAWCVWNNGSINLPIIEYVCDQLKDEIGPIENLDIDEIIKKSQEYKQELLENEEFQRNAFYEGRMQAAIMADNQTLNLRELMKVLIFSYGIRHGFEHDIEFIEKCNDFVSNAYKNEGIDSHILGLLLRLSCNINVPFCNQIVPSDIQIENIKRLLSSSLKMIKSMKSHYSASDLFFICETFECVICMLKNSNYEKVVLTKLKNHFKLKHLLRLLTNFSKRFLLARPNTFDSTKFTQLYDWELIKANKAAVDDRAHDVDVVMESYQREICAKIFNILNLIWQIKNDKMSKGKSGKNLPYIPEIILDPSSSTPKEFAKVLQRIIIKWIDFDNEPEVSKQTFDFICRFDGKLQETPLQIDRDNDENFNDLCLRTLPFFTHLKEEDKRDVLLLQERINKITINSPNTEDDHFSQEVLHNTYSLISLLIKINSLIDWKDDTDSNCIRIANQFVHNCYEYLIVTIKDPQIRECVWRFDSNFLSICWNNKLCNYCHSTLIRDILSKSQIERFNLDSIDVFKGVLSKIGNLLEWVDDTFVDDTDQEIKTPSKFDRKIEKDDYRILEYFIKNNGTELSEKSEDTEQLWDIQKCEENDSDNENYPSCAFERDQESKLMKILIQELLRHSRNLEHKEDIKKFQLLIYKLFSTIEVLDLALDTQNHILQSLEMISDLVQNDRIMENSEIRYMFYTDHSINAILSLIPKKYSLIGEGRKVRQFAYGILIRLMEIDTAAARKSFRIWNHIEDNKNMFFSRIQRLIIQFNTFFVEEKCFWTISNNLGKTDYQELLMTLQWLTLLCQNDEHWQEYLRKQDNSILNQNILLDVVELMRTSILRYRHEYVIDLLRALIKFMTASVNGKNETIVDLYVNTNVVKYCKEILTTGLYSNEIEFIKNISKNSSIERSEEMEKSLEPSINIRSPKKHNLLKEEVLWFLNCLLIQSTEDEVKMVDNYDVINSLMVLNYAQYKIYKGRDYDLELFKPDSKLSEAYNINVGFRCYHLISKLWGNNKLPQSNCVQNIDETGAFKKYWRLLRMLNFKALIFRRRYQPPSQIFYKPLDDKRDIVADATRFFDAYCSDIEIVMPNGQLETRHFEILPSFLFLTQTEKDEFWLNANLDNSKTAVISFMGFAQDKVDELFIQQEIQEKWFCLREVAMKDNWLTDLGRILIISINLILFFSLEINEGKVLDNPSFFELSYYTTKVILTVLGILMLIFFTYMTTIQGIVMIGIQKAKAIREEDQSHERSRSSRLFTLISYMLSHKEETLRTRNIWCLLFCLGFSIAGMSVDFFWFSFTMMYPLIFSPQILEVTNAIWNPKRRIVSTIVLSGVVLYWFGVIAYVFFGSEFDGAVGNSNQTLRRTLAVIFDAWHNFGLGAFLTEWGRSAIYEDTGNGEYEYRLKGAVMCFNFLFFFVVNTLLLNILSGIIIDNFAERRSKSDAIHERQNDLCFICGELSSDLPDFRSHCKYKHNIWDYMCYIGYLKAMKKEKMTDYRDIHVYSCIQQGKNDWFPAYQDFVRQAAYKKKSTDILGEVIHDSPYQGIQSQEDSSKLARYSQGATSHKHDKQMFNLEQTFREEITKQNEETKKQNQEMKQEIKELKLMLSNYVKKNSS